MGLLPQYEQRFVATFSAWKQEHAMKYKSSKTKGDPLDRGMPSIKKSKREAIDLDQFEDFEAPPKKSKSNKKISKLSEKLKKKLKDAEEGEDVPPAVFEKAFKELRKTLETNNADISLDQSTNAFLRSSLLMLTDLIPVAEASYRKTRQQSAAYALSTLVNQVRDINNDLRMVEDVESKALIMKRIVDTTMLGIAQMFLAEKFELQNRLNAYITNSGIRKAVRKDLDQMMRSASQGLQDQSNLLSDRIRAYLLGNPTYMNPNAQPEEPKKKKKGRKKVEE